MNAPTAMPRLKDYRFPRQIIANAVWSYHRFALRTADMEDLLAERGVTASRETVCKRVNRFGRHFAHCIKRDRPAAADKWHLDQVARANQRRQAPDAVHRAHKGLKIGSKVRIDRPKAR